jgi:hypothetical protein
MRRKLRERSAEAAQSVQGFTAPRYDTAFFEAVKMTNLEDE